MFNITEDALSYKLDMTYLDKEVELYDCSNFGNVEINDYGYKLGTAFTDIGMIHFKKNGDLIYKGKTYKKIDKNSEWVHKIIRGNHLKQFLKNFEATCIVNSKGYKAVGVIKNNSDVKIYGATLLVENNKGSYMVVISLDQPLEPGESTGYSTSNISDIESSVDDGLEIFYVEF